ncbi:MAG: hypothetical protein ACRC5M_02100 [Anaeroplasmataceae bacterium]
MFFFNSKVKERFINASNTSTIVDKNSIRKTTDLDFIEILNNSIKRYVANQSLVKSIKNRFMILNAILLSLTLLIIIIGIFVVDFYPVLLVLFVFFYRQFSILFIYSRLKSEMSIKDIVDFNLFKLGYDRNNVAINLFTSSNRYKVYTIVSFLLIFIVSIITIIIYPLWLAVIFSVYALIIMILLIFLQLLNDNLSKVYNSIEYKFKMYYYRYSIINRRFEDISDRSK